MKKQAVCLVCIFGVLLTAPALAEEKSTDARTMTKLQEVVVTAQRSAEPAEEVNANITVLDEEEIEMSTAKDLGDLLAEKNIGHIHKYPGNQTSVGIRGFRTSPLGNDLQGRVLVLLNGRRAGTGNLAKIMTKNIERIEIIRGPASVQYGSAAIGGLINVITKQGKGKPTFFAEGTLGSFGYEEAAAGFSGKIKGFDFSGSFSRSIMDDYDTADDDDYENTGYDEKEHASLNLGYEFLPGNRIGVVYTGYNADQVGSPNSLQFNDADDYTNNDNQSLDFIYDGKIRDGLFSWKARYFTGEDDSAWNDPPYFSYQSDRETEHEGAQAQLTWNPDQYTLTVGVDWVNYDIDQEDSYQSLETEYDNPSYFLLGKAKYFEDRLIFTGGLRYDDYKIEVEEGQGDTEDDNNVSPSLGASFFVLDNLKLRVNYAEGFRMPASDELYSDYTVNYAWGGYTYSSRYEGNPDLDPEESDTYEVGVDWYHEAFDASLTYFYTDYEDKIETKMVNLSTYTWKNVSDATVSGYEGSLSCDIGRWLKGSWHIKPYVNFTYLDEYEDDETHEDLPFVSDLLVSCGLSVSNPEDGLSTQLDFSYTGEQDITYPEGAEKGGFTVANLSVEKRVVDFSDYGDLTLRGEIKNLLDKDYAYVNGYPMPGRSFLVGLKYRY